MKPVLRRILAVVLTVAAVLTPVAGVYAEPAPINPEAETGTEGLTPEEAMNILARQEEVKELLEKLGDRERQVIRLRYGLEDGRTHTLEEIGDMLGVTRERVRQIEARAMEKLRKNAK